MQPQSMFRQNSLVLSPCHQGSTFDSVLHGVQVEAEGDVATAVTLARLLSEIPLSRGGPTSIVIFDIHALQVPAQQAKPAWVQQLALRCSCPLPHHLLGAGTLLLWGQCAAPL